MEIINFGWRKEASEEDKFPLTTTLQRVFWGRPRKNCCFKIIMARALINSKMVPEAEPFRRTVTNLTCTGSLADLREGQAPL